MSEKPMYQTTIDDLISLDDLSKQPGRTAYIDECGNFGFDFSASGTSKFYILCAVVVENSKIQVFHEKIAKVKFENHLSKTEMKSSSIGNDIRRRRKILSELLFIDFSVVLFVADKQAFYKDSPLREYRQTFIKYLHHRFYNILYHTYPKLRIIEDEQGTSEFQKSFKEYVAEHRPKFNFLNEYDFDYCDSKDELLVQLADMIGGTVSKFYTDISAPDYLEMLRSKILLIEEFPNTHEPYWGKTNPNYFKYSKDIFVLGLKRADDYIARYENDESYEKRMQIALLRYLRFYLLYINPSQYVYSTQLISVLAAYSPYRVTRNDIYRRIIAPLRDAGVIITSCARGYKLPISVDDITAYINQTHNIVAPMLQRMGICRTSIRQATDNKYDILDDVAFVQYKRYFD